MKKDSTMCEFRIVIQELFRACTISEIHTWVEVCTRQRIFNNDSLIHFANIIRDIIGDVNGIIYKLDGLDQLLLKDVEQISILHDPICLKEKVSIAYLFTVGAVRGFINRLIIVKCSLNNECKKHQFYSEIMFSQPFLSVCYVKNCHTPEQKKLELNYIKKKNDSDSFFELINDDLDPYLLFEEINVYYLHLIYKGITNNSLSTNHDSEINLNEMYCKDCLNNKH